MPAHAGQPGQPEVGRGVFQAAFGRQRQLDAAVEVALQCRPACLQPCQRGGTVEAWPGTVQGAGDIAEAEVMQELGVYPAEQVQVLSLQRAQRLDPFEQAGAVGPLHRLVQQRLDLRAEQLGEGERVHQRRTFLAPEQLENEERVAPLAGIARAEQAAQQPVAIACAVIEEAHRQCVEQRLPVLAVAHGRQCGLQPGVELADFFRRAMQADEVCARRQLAEATDHCAPLSLSALSALTSPRSVSLTPPKLRTTRLTQPLAVFQLKRC
ncbi:hypothetical protein D9M71_441640 [compost metagenome]